MVASVTIWKPADPSRKHPCLHPPNQPLQKQILTEVPATCSGEATETLQSTQEEGIPELCYRRDSHVGPKHWANVPQLLGSLNPLSQGDMWGGQDREAAHIPGTCSAAAGQDFKAAFGEHGSTETAGALKDGKESSNF